MKLLTLLLAAITLTACHREEPPKVEIQSDMGQGPIREMKAKGVLKEDGTLNR